MYSVHMLGTMAFKHPCLQNFSKGFASFASVCNKLFPLCVYVFPLFNKDVKRISWMTTSL